MAELRAIEQGSGSPMVILHGLFGSARNWTSISRELAEFRHVYALDLRNHGDSPRLASHSLDDLAGDLTEFLEKVGTPTAVLGHSMGGLAAMAAAFARPDLFERLIIVDIAPRTYHPRHHNEFAALRADLAGCASRQDVDNRMAVHVADPVVRQFLQTNLVRGEDGTFSWRLPIDVLEQASFLSTFPEAGSFPGQALFITGSNSDYVLPEDHGEIRRRFPVARIEVIQGAGHWPHFSHPAQFLALVKSFL